MLGPTRSLQVRDRAAHRDVLDPVAGGLRSGLQVRLERVDRRSAPPRRGRVRPARSRVLGARPSIAARSAASLNTTQRAARGAAPSRSAQDRQHRPAPDTAPCTPSLPAPPARRCARPPARARSISPVIGPLLPCVHLERSPHRAPSRRSSTLGGCAAGTRGARSSRAAPRLRRALPVHTSAPPQPRGHGRTTGVRSGYGMALGLPPCVGVAGPAASARRWIAWWRGCGRVGAGVLVLRGEAGVGKTALLDYLAEQRVGLPVARAAGVESEMELAFAGLHQLCAPLLDASSACRARSATRSRRRSACARDPPDRFLVGLAVLSLLGRGRPRSGRWCASSTTRSGSTAPRRRRWRSWPAGCWPSRSRWCSRCASRRGARAARAAGAAGRRLGDGDARALLESVLHGPLDERVRDRIVAETRGNPLALLELPRGADARRAGGRVRPAGRRGAVEPDRGELPAAARAAAARTRDGCCWSRRPSRSATRAGVARGRAARARVRRRRRRRRRPGWSSSVRRCGSVIRWCARRSTGRRPCGAPASAHRALAEATDPGADPIAGPGTARTRRAGLTRTWPPSWSARPAGRGRAAAWRRPPRSSNAPPS